MQEVLNNSIVTGYQGKGGATPGVGKYFQGNLIERLRMVWTYGFTGHFIIHNPDGGYISVQLLEGTIRHVLEQRPQGREPEVVHDPECRVLEALSWKRASNEWVHHAPPVGDTLDLEPGRIIEVVERMESRRQTQEWGYETCKLTSQGKGFRLPLAFDVRYLSGENCVVAAQNELSTLGRDPGCDVVLNSDSVSREHALLRVTREGLAIQDKGSLNRVRLNGQVLKPGVFYPFEIGDVLFIGDVRLRVAQEARRMHVGRQVKAREDLRLMKSKPRFMEMTAVELPKPEQKPTDLLPGGGV